MDNDNDPMRELEAIRARHEAAKQALENERFYSGDVKCMSDYHGNHAHADRATLLRLLDAAAQFIEKLCVSYAELGNEDTRRLYAFLMEGDAEDGVYVCVDEEPWGTADPPSPRLEAIAAAINALPGLIESARRVERLEALVRAMIENEPDDAALAKLMHDMDARARAALKGPTT